MLEVLYAGRNFGGQISMTKETENKFACFKSGQ